MESTRPIRALMRGLDALAVLNVRPGASVSEVALAIRLPRTTVYRILETLCTSGFIFRDPADDRYRLTVAVRGLSQGFSDDAWVNKIAKSEILELCRNIGWPVSVAALSGTSMVVRETTDHHTPLAIDRWSAGARTSLPSTIAGRVYLAFCPAAQRERLLGAGPAPAISLEMELSNIRAQGYGTAIRGWRSMEETSVSVPVTVNDRVLAVLTVRFMSSAVSRKAALERFLPQLRECAVKIVALLSKEQLPDGVDPVKSGA